MLPALVFGAGWKPALPVHHRLRQTWQEWAKACLLTSVQGNRSCHYRHSNGLKRMVRLRLRTGSEDESHAHYIRIFKAGKILQPFSQPFILVDIQEESG